MIRRLARRAIEPLPEAQTVWNGANARVISLLLGQVAAQERALADLEREVIHLRTEIGK